MKTEYKAFLNADETAAFLRIQKGTLYQKTHRREIPFYKLGKTILFNQDEIIEWMNDKAIPMVRK